MHKNDHLIGSHSPLPTSLCSEGDNDGDDDGGDCDRDGAVAVAPDDWDGDSGDADSRSERGQSLPASLGGLVRVLLINQPNLSKLSDDP